MPRNSSGVYSAPSSSVNPAVSATAFSSSAFNTLVDDIEDALNSIPSKAFEFSSPHTSSNSITGYTIFNCNIYVESFKTSGHGSDYGYALELAIAALNAQGQGRIIMPSLTHSCSRGGTISVSDAYIVWPKGSKTLCTKTSGDFITFADGLFRVGTANARVYANGSNPTSGALLKVGICRNSEFHGEFTGYFGGVHAAGTVHSKFHLDLQSDDNFTSRKNNSYLLKITSGTGSALPAELYFSGGDWRGQNGNNYLDYAVLITAGDGLFFQGKHWGFCGVAALHLAPETTTTQLTAVCVDGVYLDTVDATAFTVVQPSGYTGIFGDHHINITQIYNCGSGFYFDCDCTDDSYLRVGQLFEMDTHGGNVVRGQYWHIDAPQIRNINRSGIGAPYGVYLSGGADVSNITIFAPSVRKGASGATPNGIGGSTGLTNILILYPRFSECSIDVDFQDDTTDGTFRVIGGLTDKATQTVTADSGGGLILPHAQDTFFLGTTYNVSQIYGRSGFEGRTITLISTGTVTVSYGSNIKLNAAWSATADDTLTLRYANGNWYEMSRSAN